MWGISGVCTLALTVAKTSSHYDRFAISVPARSLLLFNLAYQDGNISGLKGPRAREEMGTYPRGEQDVSAKDVSAKTWRRTFRQKKFAETSRIFFCRNVFAETSFSQWELVFATASGKKFDLLSSNLK